MFNHHKNISIFYLQIHICFQSLGCGAAILNKYIEDTTEKGSSDGFTGQLTNIRHNMDSREQFEMLSTVSNYHSLGFPSTQDPQKIKTPNISFHEHIATPEKQRTFQPHPTTG